MNRQAHTTARRLRRFTGDRSGATALEFALVAPFLIAMLFSVLELALVFILSATLDNATAAAARTIRTGALQTAGGSTATTFRTTICDNLGWLQAGCTSNLSVDVRTYGKFDSPTIPEPLDANGDFDKTKLVYTPGNAGDIVLVRAFYEWKLITPFLAFSGLRKERDGTRMMVASAIFKNEPYN
jgi:Flp pilus assembly protein TadG